MSKQPIIPEPLGRSRRAKPKPEDPYQEDDSIPRRAIIYTRVSREEQAQGHSLEAQERECRQFIAKKKPNWTVVALYSDEHTGKTDKRPGFQAMLQALYEDRADAIVCHHLDRFSRSLHDILVYFKELGSMNVVMVFADEQFDFSDESGQMQFHILAVFADWYVQNLAREVRKSKFTRVLKGLHNNQLPFGYIRGAGGVGQVVPEEGEMLRQAFERYSTGNYTDVDIAEMLNQAGFRTRQGRRWSKDSMREVMQNEFYTGLVKYHGDLYPGQHEAIISQELYDQVQGVRRSHARSPRVYTPTIRVYLLSGLGYCAYCGRTLRAQGGPRYSYYREMSKMRGYVDCPHAGKGIQMEKAEGQLERLVRAFVVPRDWQDEIRRELERPGQREAILAERQELEERLRRVADLYADGIYSRTTYESKRDEIQQRLELLVVPDPVEVINAGFQLETMADVWPHATAVERQELCRLMFKAVYIDMEQQRIVRVAPEEDFVVLFRYNRYLEPDEQGGYRVKWPEEAG